MKKLNKFFAVLVALAMMATLCVSMAFAANPEATTGDATNPANGKITKALEVPKGTTNPGKYYKISLEQIKTGTGIEPKEVTNASFLTRYLNVSNAKTEGDVTTIYGTQDIINVADVTSLFNSKAGRYEFKVTEDQVKVFTDANGTEYTIPDNEAFNNSKAEYLLFIDVAWNDEGTALFVKNIAVQQTKNDAGGNPELDEGETVKKVDPVPDDPKPTDDNGDPFDKSDFAFTNSYVKTKATDPDGEDPTTTKDDTGLYIQKTVKPFGSESLTQEDKNAKFTFNVTVTAPAALTNYTPKTQYTYEIWNLAADGTPAAKDATATGTGKIAANTATQITLKHNQRLVFTDLDVGAKYTVNETTDSAYTTTAKDNTGATVTGAAVTDVYVNDSDASLSYENARNTSNKPTGILISNLPYIALALVAIGGLVAYVVVRRKADDEA